MIIDTIENRFVSLGELYSDYLDVADEYDGFATFVFETITATIGGRNDCALALTSAEASRLMRKLRGA